MYSIEQINNFTLRRPLNIQGETIIHGRNATGKTTLLKEVIKQLSERCRVSASGPSSEIPSDFTVLDYFSLILPEGLHTFDIILEGFDFHTKLTSLSSGQWQFIRVLSTLAKQADVYILDEPFNYLSEDNIYKIKKQIKGRIKAGAAVLYTSAHSYTSNYTLIKENNEFILN